jgi:hypothetical protein
MRASNKTLSSASPPHIREPRPHSTHYHQQASSLRAESPRFLLTPEQQETESAARPSSWANVSSSAGTMSAYLSSFLTQTTSKYNNLRRALTANDADGDTEDDSHISRVLRAYYTEKGRPFPDWLPPDPKAPPPPAPTQYAMSAGGQPATAMGQGQPGQGQRWGRSGGLSDLFDGPGQRQQGFQNPSSESLRPRMSGRGGSSDSGQPPVAVAGGRGRFADLYDQGRPGLPQRGGSYQSNRISGAEQSTSPPPGGSAKDLLKARLLGSRTTSPTPSSGSGPYAPPAREQSPSNRYDRYNSPAPQAGGNGGGGGYGQSAGRERPPAQNGSRNDSNYGGGREGGGGGAGSGSGSGSGSGGGGYGGGPYGSQRNPQPPQGGRMGLPSGPRPQRF